MREVEPYRSLTELQQAIDNGGRFYNLFTAADDAVVSPGELAKAAGVYAAGMDAFLFLELAQQRLSAKDQQAVFNLLQPSLQKRFSIARPKQLAASQFECQSAVDQAVVMTGYARFVKESSQFGGFVLVPIMVGGVMTFMPIPLTDSYCIYEFFDDAAMISSSAMIATPKDKRIEHNGPIRVGGAVRKIEYKDAEPKTHRLFLETLYFTKLDASETQSAIQV